MVIFNEETVNLTKEGGKEESMLLMVIFNEECELLLCEIGEKINVDDLWYLNMGASNRMTSHIEFSMCMMTEK